LTAAFVQLMNRPLQNWACLVVLTLQAMMLAPAAVLLLLTVQDLL